MTVQESIDKLDAALDRLDAALGSNGEVVDEGVLASVEEAHEVLIEQGGKPAVRSAELVGLDELKLYFEDRFERPLPIDLIQLLRRRNGIVVVDVDDDAPLFDEFCLLPAAEIHHHAIAIADWVAPDGTTLTTLPFGISWPGGPILALWVDDGPGPYRVVTYDDEVSDYRSVEVVAATLGDAIEKFVDCGVDVIRTTFDPIDSIELVERSHPDGDAIAAHRSNRRAEKQASTATALEQPPSEFSPTEIFRMCHEYVDGEVYQLNRWANALTPYLAEEDDFRTEEREYLGRIALAYEERLPRGGETLRRDFLDGWLRYPSSDLEWSMGPLDAPSTGWPGLRDTLEIVGGSGRSDEADVGELRASYWLAFLSCLFTPGIGHYQAGQKAKGIVFALSILMTCGLMWLLTPLSAYDLFRVRQAKLARDVGPFEFFPAERR